jgi:hypothetical protein
MDLGMESLPRLLMMLNEVFCFFQAGANHRKFICTDDKAALGMLKLVMMKVLSLS